MATSLLLSTGEQSYISFPKAFQTNHLQHTLHLLGDDSFIDLLSGSARNRCSPPHLNEEKEHTSETQY